MLTTISLSKDSQKDNWEHSMNLKDSNSILTDICISYLYLNVVRDNPELLEYSALFWSDHYHQSTKICQARVTEMTRHICRPSELRTQWTNILDKRITIPRSGPTLCLAAAVGLDGAMEMIPARANLTWRRTCRHRFEGYSVGADTTLLGRQQRARSSRQAAARGRR